ncbi:MAG: mercury(II) reductase [Dehalococcoidia bacterium]|nr:mercury(II) reductase [Dehalococcoidia bacterium]MCB9508192.1 mercury(II) reductase [Myxococcales bacterium]
MNAQRSNLVILGSGSTAFAAALRAEELGKTAVMIESRSVGGTCVNRGCLPSKNLIEAAKLVYDARHPRYPGLTPAQLEIDFGALVRQKDEIVAGYRKKRYESLLGGKFRIEHGHARFLDAKTVDVDGRRFIGDAILIATGSRPIVPDIPGLSEVPYLTSDLLTSGESIELTELPRSLLIVGGGYIALELGQMFSRFGTEVTILERSDELLAAGYEPEVGPTVRAIFEAEGITVLTRTIATAVRRDGDGVVATCGTDGQTRELRAERLLVATGRRPNTDDIGIERADVRIGAQGQVVVDDHLRTSVPHIFAAGDVIGREQGSQMATPIGGQDGGIAAHNALSSEPPRKVNHRVVPRAIFIDPPLAVVGMAEEAAVAAGHPCWCRATPMSVVPRAGAIRDTAGFVKMVADARTDEVLGVTMIGNGAAEVIHEAAMALRFRATLHDFIELLHVYPTMAEALKVAAISRYKDPSKLSCCAE